MEVFISHSFRDLAVYSTLCLAVDASGIKRWDPKSLKPGELLVEGLHSAIANCHVCVFLVTKRAIDSAWCGAELGAFWGAGKKVLLFMADPDVDEATLPPQFKGTLRVANALDLVAALREIEQTFNNATNKQALEPTLYATSADYGSETAWDAILTNTASHFDLLGLTLDQWRKTNKFREKISAKAASGCKVRFLIMHEANPVLTSLFPDEDIEKVRRNIRESFAVLEQVAAAGSGIEIRRIKRGVAYFSLTRSDDSALLTQYVSSSDWGYGPTWRCIRGSTLYDAAVTEFNHLWAASAEA